MPNPHFNINVISRNGRHRSRAKTVAAAAYNTGSKVASLGAAAAMMTSSVVASAAYRSGEALFDMQVEKTYDYSHKDEVVYTAIMAPDDAPPWARDRMLLWNGVEKFEKRKDAQLARDLVAALPRELNTQQQIALVRDYVQEHFVSQNMVADIAIHDKESASDGGRQPHVHILLTMRAISAEGFAAKKNRNWNKKERLQAWRQGWADTTNLHLELAGREERLDLRSYKVRGIDKIPGVHLGPDAWQLEQQGQETDKGDRNREIDHTNLLYDITKHYHQPEIPEGTSEVVEQGERISKGEPSTDSRTAALSGDEQKRVDSGSKQKRRVISDMDRDAQNAQTPTSPAQWEAMHMQWLRRSVQGMMQQPIARTVEQLIRWRDHAAAALEKARELVQSLRNAFDRYATGTMWQMKERDRDGPER